MEAILGLLLAILGLILAILGLILALLRLLLRPLSEFVGCAGMLPEYAANLRNLLCGIPPGVRRSREAT